METIKKIKILAIIWATINFSPIRSLGSILIIVVLQMDLAASLALPMLDAVLVAYALKQEYRLCHYLFKTALRPGRKLLNYNRYDSFW